MVLCSRKDTFDCSYRLFLISGPRNLLSFRNEWSKSSSYLSDERWELALPYVEGLVSVITCVVQVLWAGD